MKGGLAYMLAQLSDRERLLLVVMALVALPLGVVFLVVLPMLEQRDAAQQQAREQAALLAWVSEQVTKMPIDAGPGANTENAATTIGISGIEDSLVAATLRDQVAQLVNRPDGGVDLSLDNAPFDRVADWLRQAQPDWGYHLSAFKFDLASPGLVNAVFELRAP